MARRAEGWKLKLEDGWYVIRFRHAGRRHKLALGTQDASEAGREAPRRYAEHISGLAASRRVAASASSPLKTLATEWLASLEGKGGLADTTVSTYLTYVRAWTKRWQRLGQLTETALALYLRERLGKAPSETTRTAIRSTVRKEASALRGFFGWLKDGEIIAEVPAVELPSKAKGVRAKRRREPVPLSHEEALSIVRVLPALALRQGPGETRRYPIRAYGEYLYETGLRQSTVERQRVGEAWAPGRTELVIDDDEDKATWGRTIPLSRRALALLEEHAPASGPLWGRRKMTVHLRRAARQVGLDEERAGRISAYDLRHARINALTDAGATRAGVQLLVGHRHAATTERYMHPLAVQARQALKLLPDGTEACAPSDVACRGLPRWHRSRRSIGSPDGSVASEAGPDCARPEPGKCLIL
jgi:integrase